MTQDGSKYMPILPHTSVKSFTPSHTVQERTKGSAMCLNKRWSQTPSKDM